MATTHPPDWESLVSAAYDVLLQRVAEGRITEADPVQVLAGLNEAWAYAPSATRLAAALADYARQQVGVETPGVDASRTRVRRQRLYAIAEQLYEQTRVAPPAPHCSAASPA